MVRCCLRLAVDSDHLLPPCMRHSGDNPRFCDRCGVLVFEDSSDGNPLMAEAAEQQAAGVVIADDAYRKNIDAEGGEIVHCVGSAARKHGAFAVPQNENRGLAGHPGYLAKNKLVGNHVAQHRHRDARECLNDLVEAVGLCRCLAHSAEEQFSRFSHAFALRSSITRKMVSRASAALSSSICTRAIAMGANCAS